MRWLVGALLAGIFISGPARAAERFPALYTSHLGEQGVFDLTAMNGCYDPVSMTLNVAEILTPADGALALPDLETAK